MIGTIHLEKHENLLYMDILIFPKFQRKGFATKVIKDIHISRENTNTIHSQAQDCDIARQNVVGIIGNLSAVSEENAAATQETTASMQELNATINMVANSAVALKNMSISLEEQTKFFKL